MRGPHGPAPEDARTSSNVMGRTGRTGRTAGRAGQAERRTGYGPSMNRVRSGELPWTKLDDLHRAVLDKLLIEYRITGLTPAEIEHFNRAWHRLAPWPDAVPGLTRLKRKFIIAPLSNGNV